MLLNLAISSPGWHIEILLFYSVLLLFSYPFVVVIETIVMWLILPSIQWLGFSILVNIGSRALIIGAIFFGFNIEFHPYQPSSTAFIFFWLLLSYFMAFISEGIALTSIFRVKAKPRHLLVAVGWANLTSTVLLGTVLVLVHRWAESVSFFE